MSTHSNDRKQLEPHGSIDEVAQWLGVSPTTVRQLVRSKKLPARKVGQQWRLPLRQVEKAIDDAAERELATAI